MGLSQKLSVPNAGSFPQSIHCEVMSFHLSHPPRLCGSFSTIKKVPRDMRETEVANFCRTSREIPGFPTPLNLPVIRENGPKIR